MRGTTDTNSERGTMCISARNVLKGTITDVEIGAVSGVVSIKVGETALTSIITMEAIHDLGLKKGMTAYAVIKASHVMFARGDEPLNNLSARNQLVGTVTTVRPGKTDGRVSLTLADGNIITGSVFNDMIGELGLEVGNKAVAIVKSTDLMIGVD